MNDKAGAYFVTMAVAKTLKIRVEADNFDEAEDKAYDHCEENGIEMQAILEIKKEGHL